MITDNQSDTRYRINLRVRRLMDVLRTLREVYSYSESQLIDVMESERESILESISLGYDAAAIANAVNERMCAQ
ncbi:MAG: hypothetical protein UX36_C0006G0005 [Microgenomates group bacterium GW2011_GWC1_46_15]|nr:MAG: hypothetical protein UX36_C0006G0005 [Microgenomates group bacterium GW2011_GWC1_46_15]